MEPFPARCSVPFPADTDVIEDERFAVPPNVVSGHQPRCPRCGAPVYGLAWLRPSDTNLRTADALHGDPLGWRLYPCGCSLRLDAWTITYRRDREVGAEVRFLPQADAAAWHRGEPVPDPAPEITNPRWEVDTPYGGRRADCPACEAPSTSYATLLLSAADAPQEDGSATGDGATGTDAAGPVAVQYVMHPCGCELDPAVYELQNGAVRAYWRRAGPIAAARVHVTLAGADQAVFGQPGAETSFGLAARRRAEEHLTRWGMRKGG